MHPRNIPFLAFLIWSIICWRWYVCDVKSACAVETEPPVPVVQPLEELGVKEVPASVEQASGAVAVPTVSQTKVTERVVPEPVQPAASAPKLVAKGGGSAWSSLSAHWPTALNEQAIDQLQLVRKASVLEAHFPHAVGSLSQVELLAPFLRELAGYLIKHPGQLRITCHTDGVGSEQENQRRSKEAAVLIHTFLIQQGVPSGQVVAIGMGEQSPLATNDHPQGRYCNRRVEFELHP